MIGTKLADRYEIVSELGRGGMGVVYKARDPMLNRDVAVKLIPPTQLTQKSEERFRREAQVVARMDHPSIVPIFDIGRHEGSLYFLMPVVAGANLRDFLRSSQRMLGEILEIVIQVADALDYSHDLGVIHRDIKPENIMVLSEEGGVRVRVMDFGLAKVATDESLTKTGTLVGTVSYFSPEQVAKNMIDSRSDIYSLGVVLYESICGFPPFGGEMQSVLYRIVHEFPRPLREIGVKIEAELDGIVLKALAKDPSRRYQRAGELAEDLRSYQGRLVQDQQAASMVLSSAITASLERSNDPFIGREEELGLLQSRLNAAIDGECQFVVIAGEPGIGKTRLLEELERLARARRIRVLHGRFVEQDRTFSYQGFCEVIQEYFRHKETESLSGEKPDFSDLAHDLISLFPVLSEISEIRSAASGETSAAESESTAAEDRTFVYELLARTLARIAGGKPLMIVFENLHGAEMSLDALQYVVRRLGPTPTLIAGTYRQTEIDKAHPLVRVLDGFAGDHRFASIFVGPLSAAEHKELLQATVGSSRLSDSVVIKLYEATEANPFFTKELVRSLIDLGGITVDETGEWSLSGEMGISADALPSTIQQAVEKRVERLPEELKNILSTASVLGKTFDFRDLELLAGDEGDIDDAVDRLIAEGLVEEERESRGDRLTFSSGIVRDVLYNELSRRKRKSLHRKYAQALEARHAGRLDRIYPQLVHHFSEGDVPDKTVEYGLQLARKSASSYSAEETIQVIRTVLEFVEDEEWNPDPLLEGEARLLLGTAYRVQGNLDSALRETETAIRIFEKGERLEEIVRATLLASEVAWQGRRIEETRQWLVRGIAVARKIENPEALTRFLSLAATVANLRGEYEKAQEYLDEIETIEAAGREPGPDRRIPRGGELRVALANRVTATEPAAVGLDEEVEVLALAFETLFATDERGHIVPSLCDSWEILDGGRSLRVELREGVTFHDGTPLTAEVVKKSFERSILLRKREMSAAFTTIRGVAEFRKKESAEVEGIVVHSPRVLEIRITEPLAIYPALLTDPTTGIVHVTGAGGDHLAEDAAVAGTGPFRIVEHEAGRVRLERFDEHWSDEKPPLDGVEFRTEKGSAGIASGLRSGELDLGRDLLPSDLEDVLRDPRFRTGLVETPKKNSYFIALNTFGGSGKSEPLRRALAGVVRTHDLVWRTLGRLAQPAAGVIPPGVLGHDPGRKRAALTREEAEALIAESGLVRPVRLRASVHPLFQDRYRSLTSAIFDAWAAIGVEVEIATPSMETFLDSFQESNGIDLIIARWNADYDDPDNFTNGLFRSENGVFASYYSAKESDAVFESARRETDPAARESLYRKFEASVIESGAVIPLFHEIDYRVASPKVHGLHLRSTPPYVNYIEMGKGEERETEKTGSRAGGGILRVPILEPIDDLDPLFAGTVERSEVIPTVFQTLTRATEGARIGPWLCSRYEIEDRGRRFRFVLRDDVRFHNGRRLTARDVRHSWERLLLRNDSPNQQLLRPIRGAKKLIEGEARDLEGFRIHSALEFTVDLEQPLAFFATIISHPATSIVQEGTDRLSGSWRESCVGTGPFRVARFEPGRQLELERNPLYWRSGFPKSEGLVFHLGMGPDEVLKEFRAGHLSVAAELLPRDVAVLRHDPEFASGYREIPRLSTYFAGFNVHRGALADPELRRTLVQCVDVPAIVRRTLGRLAIPAHGVIPPGLIGSSAEPLGVTGHAPKKKPEETIQLKAVVHPMFFGQYASTARDLEEAFRNRGVTIEILNKSMSDYVEMVTAGVGDLVVGRWIADFPDADTFIYGLLFSKGGFLGAYSSTEEIDRLAEKGRVEIDPSIRHSIYRDVERIITREALLLPLFHEQVYRFARPEITGLTLAFGPPEVPYEDLAVK